jgi:predicted TIM-barrel fold metal-dependent hydrolase
MGMSWNGYTVIDMDSHIVERPDRWLFATDWPHGDTTWPESVQQIVERPGLSEQAKRKILGDNALRLCPRLQQ